MITLTGGLLVVISSEPFYYRMGESGSTQIAWFGGRNAHGHQGLVSIVISAAIFSTIYFVTSRSKVSDMFFVGMVRLIFSHFFVCVWFGIAGYNWFEDAFDGVDGLHDAMYLSAIIHTTVGYGDFSVLPGVGRLIVVCHAILVQGLNFVSVAAFVTGVDPSSPDYTQMPYWAAWEYGLLIPAILACWLTIHSAKEDIAKVGKDGVWKRSITKQSLFFSLPASIIQAVVTGISMYMIQKVLDRRVRGQEYSNDLKVVGKLAIVMSVCFVCMSYNEAKLMLLFDIGNSKCFPWLSCLFLVLFFIRTLLLSFTPDMPENAHDMVSLNFTFTSNLGVMMVFAVFYWFTRAHFGKYDIVVERVDEYVGCIDYNKTSDSCSQNLTVSISYPCTDCDMSSFTTSLPVSSVEKLVRRENGAADATASNTSSDSTDIADTDSVSNDSSNSTARTGLFTDRRPVRQGLTLVEQLQKSGNLPTSPTHTRFMSPSRQSVYLPRLRPFTLERPNTVESTAFVEADVGGDVIVQTLNYTIHSFTDAIYFSAITHTTVGFGDINGANDFMAHTMTLCHVWLVMLMNCAAIGALIPDSEEVLHSRLKRMELNDDGRPADEGELNFVNVEVLHEMQAEDPAVPSDDDAPRSAD